jgi:hypothetical protein
MTAVATAPQDAKPGKKGRGAKVPKQKQSRGEKRVVAPTLPSVNILSPWVFEAIAMRRLRRRFVLGALALVVLIAGAWFAQQMRVDQAQKVLGVEQAETTRLTAQTQELAPVRTFVAGVGAEETTIQDTMAGEIYFSRVLENLQRATPLGARVQTASVTLDPAAVALALAGGAETPPAEAATTPGAVPADSACPGPDPFNTKVVVGCVTLTGTAGSRAEVGDLVIALGGDELFVEPFISTTTTADGSEVAFSGSVGLSKKVYSGRYAELDKLINEGGSQ